MLAAWVYRLLRPLLDARVWAVLAVGVVLGAAGTALPRRRVPPPAPVSGIPGVAALAAAAAAAARAPGPYYIVVEKHYVDLGGRDDRPNWFYGTVRNGGTAPGACSLIATFFDEDDRALESTVIPLPTLAPGQQATFRMHPHTQNVGSAGVSFTAPCGRGIMWHYIP
jgi:hypothetical protein